MTRWLQVLIIGLCGAWLGFILGCAYDFAHYRSVVAKQRKLLAEYQGLQGYARFGGIVCPECGGLPWTDDGECCFVCGAFLP
jgi:hypothetical protein